jgi:hypothetical protein
MKKKMEMYPVRESWHLIKPYLSEPAFKTRLDRAMFELSMRLFLNSGKGFQDYKMDNGLWWPEYPPYRFQILNLVTEAELDSLEWYQIHGCCFAMAQYTRVLARCVMPDLNWRILKNERHAVPYGKDENGIVLFDLLNGDTQYSQRMSPQQVYDFADPDIDDQTYAERWDADYLLRQQMFDRLYL